MGQSFGYKSLRHPQLDIQLHNAYLVLPPLLTTLVLLPVATVVTGVRVLAGVFRHFGPNAELE